MGGGRGGGGALFPDLSPTLNDVINCYRLPVSCEGSPPGSFTEA